MALFEITTRSVFEKVYLIESDSIEEASLTVLNDGIAPYLYQKQLEETIYSSLVVYYNTPSHLGAIADIRKRGYVRC